jgi:hypothetical protein
LVAGIKLANVNIDTTPQTAPNTYIVDPCLGIKELQLQMLHKQLLTVMIIDIGFEFRL